MITHLHIQFILPDTEPPVQRDLLIPDSMDQFRYLYLFWLAADRPLGNYRSAAVSCLHRWFCYIFRSAKNIIPCGRSNLQTVSEKQYGVLLSRGTAK